jgi:peroxiredoxin
MNQNLYDVRTYRYEDENTGKQKFMKVTYSIVVKDGIVQNVFNEYNRSVERNSEAFEYYTRKFSN